jgi:hypothetical protein
MLIFLGAVALGVGVWVGIGAPGVAKREDRITHRPRRLPKHTALDWLRPPKV